MVFRVSIIPTSQKREMFGVVVIKTKTLVVLVTQTSIGVKDK